MRAIGGPIEWERTIFGSIFVVVGVLITIATYRTTRDTWVLLNVALVIICNIFYIADTWSTESIFLMIATYLDWSCYLMYHWLFVIKYLKCSFKIPVEVE